MNVPNKGGIVVFSVLVIPISLKYFAIIFKFSCYFDNKLYIFGDVSYSSFKWVPDVLLSHFSFLLCVGFINHEVLSCVTINIY